MSGSGDYRENEIAWTWRGGTWRIRLHLRWLQKGVSGPELNLGWKPKRCERFVSSLAQSFTGAVIFLGSLRPASLAPVHTSLAGCRYMKTVNCRLRFEEMIVVDASHREGRYLELSIIIYALLTHTSLMRSAQRAETPMFSERSSYTTSISIAPLGFFYSLCSLNVHGPCEP